MGWRTIEQAIRDGSLPIEVLPALPVECKCGYEYIVSDNLKKFRCMNPVCPVHMAERVLSVIKKLGVKGIGIKGAQKYTEKHNITCPAQIVPILFGDNKPKRHLWEIARYCGIEGIDSNWQTLLEGVRTPEDALAKLPPHLHPYIKTIFESAKYFDVVLPMHKRTVYIAIHGDITGFAKRDDWVRELNFLEGNLVNTVLKTTVTNSVSYLITEQMGDTGCTKIKTAVSKQVPIITPDDYYNYVAYLTGRMLSE